MNTRNNKHLDAFKNTGFPLSALQMVFTQKDNVFHLTVVLSYLNV